MVRRVVVMAACIDVAYLLLFTWLGSAPMAWINLVSIAMYAAAYRLIGQRRNRAGLWLIWTEVFLHAAIGSLLIGWDSGFHYYLLMFVPAIVIANTRGLALPLVGGLLAYYLALKALCDHVGALMPLEGDGLRIVWWIHVCIAFAMSGAIAAFYRQSIVIAERRLVQQASSDALTGLHNRSHFHVIAANTLARSQRSGEPVALLLCDIDHFKQVNDQHGHATGDQVLVHVASTLKARLRDCDALARWGGEEFLVLMPDCPQPMAAAAAERIRGAIEATPLHLPAGRTVPVTLSLGTAQVLGPDDLEAAIARADRALYRSKHAGRNRVSSAEDPATPVVA